MTSEIYVWVWLPGETEPTPAGVLTEIYAGSFAFSYGNRYRARKNAISLSPTLPLEVGEEQASTFGPTGTMPLPGALRDATPDAWGRRVILNTTTGARGDQVDTGDLDERTYMLRSGSNRLGAIDFQASSSQYVPRNDTASLEDLLRASELIESGEPLPKALHDALLSGTAIGGAQPKALVQKDGEEFLAKFPVTGSDFPTVGAEAASLYLASHAGINVPEAQMVTALNKAILLTKRFDRPGGGLRTPVVSALTLLGLDEDNARYGSYIELLEALRRYHDGGIEPGGELFSRIAFNIAISNSDDHLRNHAALWDGRALSLTPAYDLSPGRRSGETAFQNISYNSLGERESNFDNLMKSAAEYGLSTPEAKERIDQIIATIYDHWDDAADFAMLSSVDKASLRTRQFLNPGALYGYATQFSVAPATSSTVLGAARAKTTPKSTPGSFAPRTHTPPHQNLF